MLTGERSLELSVDESPEMPYVEELEALYRKGTKFRKGEVVMIAGRSGSGKSAFAMWLAAMFNVPTLYFSADMSPYQASVRLACCATGMTTSEVEAHMKLGGNHRKGIMDALRQKHITFSFGAITMRGMDEELDAWVELFDSYPELIVIDNLMDMEDAQADYQAQMEMMQAINELARHTGATVFILHHASDKSWDAKSAPWAPPSRDQVKGGLSEKPELSLSVGLNPQSNEFQVATIKQRMGRSDPTAQSYASFTADLSTTRFHKWSPPRYLEPDVTSKYVTSLPA